MLNWALSRLVSGSSTGRGTCANAARSSASKTSLQASAPQKSSRDGPFFFFFVFVFFFADDASDGASDATSGPSSTAAPPTSPATEGPREGSDDADSSVAVSSS